MTSAAPSVLAECTQITYRRRRSSLYAHLLVAGLALSIGWGEPVRAANVALVGLLLGYTAVGVLSGRWFLSRPWPEAGIRRWARALYFQLALLALIYNAIFLNLVGRGVPHALDYQLLVLALFCAGGAATYQHLRGLAIVFIVFAIGPLAAYHLFADAPSGRAIAFVLVVFIVFMSNTSLALHRDAIERLALTRELNAAKEAAEQLARTDGLTGLLNRRALFEVGRTLLDAARRHERPLSVALLDLDHFKAINDRFGHAAGDAVLVAVGQVLRDTRRSSDVVGRLGGEEFAIVLPETDAGAATCFADRLRRAIHAVDVGTAAPGAAITASLGVAERIAEDLDLDSLVDRADRGLYRAKAEGRDRVVAGG